MPRGGARLGAGRKPNPLKAAKKAEVEANKAKKAGSVIGQALSALSAIAPAVQKGPVPGVSPPPPPELPDSLTKNYDDPLEFLTAVMNEPKVPLIARQDAAKALMPFKHAKKGETGKKEAATAKAKETGAARFGAAAPPPLRAVGS